MDKCRTRRLRKKLRVDEFQELGFEVSFELRDGLDEAQIDQFWDEFIVQSIEKNGLAFGGSTNGFVSAFGRGSTNKMHRDPGEKFAVWRIGRTQFIPMYCLKASHA